MCADAHLVAVQVAAQPLAGCVADDSSSCSSGGSTPRQQARRPAQTVGVPVAAAAEQQVGLTHRR